MVSALAALSTMDYGPTPRENKNKFETFSYRIRKALYWHRGETKTSPLTGSHTAGRNQDGVIFCAQESTRAHSKRLLAELCFDSAQGRSTTARPPRDAGLLKVGGNARAGRRRCCWPLRRCCCLFVRTEEQHQQTTTTTRHHSTSQNSFA